MRLMPTRMISSSFTELVCAQLSACSIFRASHRFIPALGLLFIRCWSQMAALRRLSNLRLLLGLLIISAQLAIL